MNKDNILSNIELSILSLLKERHIRNNETSPWQITELAEALNIRDVDEILRALYTLEGKDLAKPHPEGDLTSHEWEITEIGIRALQVLRG